MKAMHKQLREIGELLGLDCGDSSCLCAAHKGGMRTNGGCRCDISGTMLARVEAWRAEEARLRAELDRFSQAQLYTTEHPGLAALVKAARAACDDWDKSATAIPHDEYILRLRAALKPFEEP